MMRPENTLKEADSDLYAPRKEDKFSFGLWTVGNSGRDGFGAATRKPLDPAYRVEKLAEIGAWGVNFQDDDLVAFDAPATERSRVAQGFKRLLADNGLAAAMATTSLFVHPIFKEGAYTAADPGVRAFALQKTMRAIDVAAEVGAPIFNLWLARDGVDSEASKDYEEGLKRLREALDFLSHYVLDRGYDLRFALEPKPNEPRGDSFLPTAGHNLAFIATLDCPQLVGMNIEFGHETIAGLNFYHEVSQALEAGKLLHIDLNDQKTFRYDQNFRFASENLKNAFFVVKLLEEKNYSGPRHFDVHPYRTEDEAGVWECAVACMRTYNMLKERARRFAEDREIQELLADLNRFDLPTELEFSGYNARTARNLKNFDFDIEKLARRAYHHEKLDLLTNNIILGLR